MALSPSKLAPSAAVLAFVGYCAWPSVSSMISDSKKYNPPEDIAELAASVLTPKLAPLPEKNPFGGMDLGALLKAKEKKIEIKSSSAADISKMPKNVYDPIGSLKLQATCIIENQRVAIINGKTYGPKDTLLTGNALKPSFKIVDILPTKVLLGDNGRVLELTYTNGPLKTPSDGKAGKVAKMTMTSDKERKPSGKSPEETLIKAMLPFGGKVTANQENTADSEGK